VYVPLPILDLTKLECKLQLGLTIGYHNISRVFESLNMLELSANPLKYR
jgi:hypothetical protein